MGVLVRIAARNLREHKAKTLVIGIIISVGVIVLVAGNSLMDTPRLPHYDEILTYLRGRDDLTGVTAQITGFSRLSVEGYSGGAFTVLFSINPESYRQVTETPASRSVRYRSSEYSS